MIPDLLPREIERFYGKLKVTNHGLIWAGGRVDSGGYGHFTISRGGMQVRIAAHRLAYKLGTGADPGESDVSQECGIRLCCTLDCLAVAGRGRDSLGASQARRASSGTGPVIPALRRDEVERFRHSLRVAGDCLIWTGPVGSSGRGAFSASRGGRQVHLPAHRVACVLFMGFDPQGRGWLPSCRNVLCCAPDHILGRRTPRVGAA